MPKYCEIQKFTESTRADKWWENNDKKKTGNRWKTLKHNGVLFPPEYEPLPKNVKVLYKGKPVELDSQNTKNKFNISAEEGAYFMAMILERDDRLSEKNTNRKRTTDKVFIKNFWGDWKKILGKTHQIQNIEDVDFRNIQKYIREKSEKKKSSRKSMTKEEKGEEKELKGEMKEIYGYAVVDGIKMALGNYVVQPPGLYTGHGEQPLRGKIKGRIRPEDITLNLSSGYIPKCMNNGKPCKWGDIVENREVTWIAFWRHPITEEVNYVWLKRDSSEWVCASDMEKFDKARKLGDNIESVRKQYKKDLKSDDKEKRQLATAVYLLDELAIRPGTEKDEAKEAGTLGLTTLKCNNISFEGDNEIKIDFIGKSSIQYTKKFKVPDIVYKNLTTLCKGKKKSEIFPDVNAISLNSYLKELLPGITAKVFRTYKASSILQKELNKNIPDIDDPVHEKKIIYDKVNIEVAKALNHKKLGGSSDRVEKIKEKIKQYQEKKKNATTEKQKASAQKSIDLQKTKLEEAEHNISTSTSKVNYLDPRITVSWCKKGEVPIEKIYNKTQLGKFVWAMETSSDWKF